MKYFIFISIILSIGFYSCGQKKNPGTGWNYNETQSDAVYEVKIPNKANMKEEKPRKITLQQNKRDHLISFGTFETETHWKVYDWLSYHGSDRQLPKPLIDTSFKANQESRFSISSLDTGKFMVNFTAIAEGCNFELTIVKNDPPYDK